MRLEGVARVVETEACIQPQVGEELWNTSKKSVLTCVTCILQFEIDICQKGAKEVREISQR